MGLWFDVTRVATVVSLALLVGLVYVWVQNYRRLHTRFTVGFLAFGGFLLAANGYAVYLYMVDPTTSRWFLEIPTRYNLAFMVLAVLQLGALSALAWVTLE